MATTTEAAHVEALLKKATTASVEAGDALAEIGHLEQEPANTIELLGLAYVLKREAAWVNGAADRVLWAIYNQHVIVEPSDA